MKQQIKKVQKKRKKEKEEEKEEKKEKEEEKKEEKEKELLCNIGENELCLTCEKGKCGSCNPGYKLKDGKCFFIYSFKATYESTKTYPLTYIFSEDFSSNFDDIKIINV